MKIMNMKTLKSETSISRKLLALSLVLVLAFIYSIPMIYINYSFLPSCNADMNGNKPFIQNISNCYGDYTHCESIKYITYYYNKYVSNGKDDYYTNEHVRNFMNEYLPIHDEKPSSDRMCVTYGTEINAKVRSLDCHINTDEKTKNEHACLSN